MLNLNKNKIIPATEMLELNKNKLIPATEIIAYWGEIKGDISKQTDLVELTTDLDTSIKGWVTEQGFLTEHQDLSDYALKSEVPSLDGYATENWVSEQGYLTEHQDLSDYALKSEVPSLDGYATEEWVNNKLSNYTTNSDFTSLQNRVVTLETNYGDALNITNQILG